MKNDTLFNSFTFSFILFIQVTSTTLAQEIPNLKFPSQKIQSYYEKEIQFHAQEIKITDQKLARKIFRYMPGKAVHSPVVYGLMYKHHKYLMCQRTPDAITTCSVFFSHKADGTLSSFYHDTEYGKGDVVDYVHNKALIFPSDISLYPNGIKIRFTKKEAVEKALTKIDLGEQKDSRGVNYISESYFGKHISCTQYTNYREGKKQPLHFQECAINIPLNRKQDKPIVLPRT